MNGIFELLTTRKWMMHPESLQALRMVIQQNLNGHVQLQGFEKHTPYLVGMDKTGSPMRMDHISDEGGMNVKEAEFERFVAVIPVMGPITRNGDACSYGSIDVRNAMLEAAQIKECSGVVVYINTPGGSCAAVADYQYGIDALHEAKKKCIAFVDGMCASCGLYLATMCDERYYMNDKDQIGSVGVMAAFYTEKSGEKNQYTNETYHELYASQSWDKNKWVRDASEGDEQMLQEDLDKECEIFMAAVRKACPNAEDEHLHGKMFDASEVKGILMDDKSTLSQVIDKLIAEHAQISNNQPNHNNNTMNEKYQTIAQLAGVEELVVTEEGSHMALDLLDAMQENLQKQAEAKEEAEKTHLQTMTEKDEQINALQQQVTELQQKMAESGELSHQALEDARKEYEQKLSDAQKDAEQKLADLQEKADAQEAQAQEQMKEAEQKIADMAEKLHQMEQRAGQEPQAGAQPKNNGEGLEQPKMVVGYPQYNPSLSPMENKLILEEYEAKRKAMIASKQSR